MIYISMHAALMTVEKGVITLHLLLVLYPLNWLKYVGNAANRTFSL
jgi:hypothetical protein